MVGGGVLQKFGGKKIGGGDDASLHREVKRSKGIRLEEEMMSHHRR